MTDKEFNFSSSGEFSGAAGDEFNTAAAGLAQRAAANAAAGSDAADEEARREKRARTVARRIAAKTAAALLTVVLVADSFGIDLLGSAPAARNLLFALTEEQHAFLSALYTACAGDDSGAAFAVMEDPAGGLPRDLWFDGERAYIEYEMERGTGALLLNEAVPGDTLKCDAVFYADGEASVGDRELWLSFAKNDAAGSYGKVYSSLTIKEIDESGLVTAFTGISTNEHIVFMAAGGLGLKTTTLEGEFVLAPRGSGEDAETGYFLENGTLYDIPPANQDDKEVIEIKVSEGYLKGLSLWYNENRGETQIVVIDSETRKYSYGAGSILFPDDPFYHTLPQLIRKASAGSQGSAQSAQPAHSGQTSEPEPAAPTVTYLDLTDEQKAYLDSLYSAGFMRDTDAVVVMLKADASFMKDLTTGLIWYDGENASASSDLLTEGKPAMSVQPNVYEYTQAGLDFFFDGTPASEDGSRRYIVYILGDPDSEGSTYVCDFKVYEASFGKSSSSSSFSGEPVASYNIDRAEGTYVETSSMDLGDLKIHETLTLTGNYLRDYDTDEGSFANLYLEDGTVVHTVSSGAGTDTLSLGVSGGYIENNGRLKLYTRDSGVDIMIEYPGFTRYYPAEDPGDPYRHTMLQRVFLL